MKVMKRKEQLFDECSRHLLEDEKPSRYFNMDFMGKGDVSYPFSLLLELPKTEQSKQYHKEGNVWNHTMLVIDEAAKVRTKSKNPKVFMWAALLHDIGKPRTTKIRKGRITAYHHEEAGADLAEEFLSEVTDDMEFIKEVKGLVRWHMQILHVVKETRFSDIDRMLQEVDPKEIALLGWCDRMGRVGSVYKDEKENIEKSLKKTRFKA